MLKKRIGIVSHDFHPHKGGLGRHATELLEHANKAELPFHFIGISPNRTSLKNHQQSLGFTKRLFADQLQFSLFFQFQVENIIRNASLDGIIINGGPGGVFCLRKPSVPLIYIANHTYAQQCRAVPGQEYKRLFLLPLERCSYKNATHVVAISNTTRRSLIENYSLREESTSVIPPGFSFSTEPQFTRSPNAKDFLFVGRLDERKGIRFLLEAYSDLAVQTPDSCLHIVGTGIALDELKSIGREHIESNRIRFYGFTSEEEIATIRKRCIAQIIPSRLEGFGIAAVESILAGTPLIASKVDGLTDIVTHNETGLLFQFGDEAQLQRHCLQALQEPEQMEQFARKAYSVARDRFCWENVLIRYSDLLTYVFTKFG